MNNTRKGFFEAKNPNKTATPRPFYKSSWELAFMDFCDNHPSIISWAYEPIKIPYMNPLTMQMTIYVPDFLIVYLDKSKKQQAQLVEIKPSKQAHLNNARSMTDKAHVAVNAAKWDAASKYARRNGMTFRILTEQDIFRNPK